MRGRYLVVGDFRKHAGSGNAEAATAELPRCHHRLDAAAAVLRGKPGQGVPRRYPPPRSAARLRPRGTPHEEGAHPRHEFRGVTSSAHGLNQLRQPGEVTPQQTDHEGTVILVEPSAAQANVAYQTYLGVFTSDP